MSRFKDGFSPRGIFSMRVYRNGILSEESIYDNLIVNGAREQMARLIAGEVAGRSVSKIAFGTNGTDASYPDNEITDMFAKEIERHAYTAMGQVRFDWKLETTENNGMAIMEFGLLTEDGMLFARRTRGNPIHKDSDISIEGEWTIMFN